MKIVSLGAGNLATHLIIELQKKGFEIEQVYSRSEASAKELAEKLHSLYTTEIEGIVTNAHIYIISICDDAIESFSKKLSLTNQLVIHTAGSVSMEIFTKKFENHGVLYPLQTFSKSRAVDFSNIPVFIEANRPKNLKVIYSIANSVTNNVFIATSQERLQLHLASVFCSNFVNHLCHLSAQIVEKSGLEFSVFAPLILETVQKALASGNPNSVQTGPAVRNDRNVLQKHAAILNNRPEIREIYHILSESIINEHKGK